MFLKEVYSADGHTFLRSEEAEPLCSHDFCDACGDCLACYGNDECRTRGTHRWIVYADEAGVPPNV